MVTLCEVPRGVTSGVPDGVPIGVAFRGVGGNSLFFLFVWVGGMVTVDVVDFVPLLIEPIHCFMS